MRIHNEQCSMILHRIIHEHNSRCTFQTKWYAQRLIYFCASILLSLDRGIYIYCTRAAGNGCARGRGSDVTRAKGCVVSRDTPNKWNLRRARCGGPLHTPPTNTKHYNIYVYVVFYCGWLRPGTVSPTAASCAFINILPCEFGSGATDKLFR